LIFFVGYIFLIGIHLETNVVGSGGIRKKWITTIKILIYNLNVKITLHTKI
jgi:hypothetical protein